MNASEWAARRALFHQALDLPPHEREAWLRQAAAGDHARVAAVLALLESADATGDFMDSPAAVDADVLAELPLDASGAVAELQPGDHVGPYEIRRQIGRGGMGVVYLAHDDRLGRDVALKALRAEASSDPAQRERLKREARAAATITHPHVATVYALEEIGGRLFIASEYVDGQSLREAIAERPVPPEQALRLVLNVAEALGAAHAAGIVHRDLKPDNVLVTRNGGVKVVDFGIAYVAPSDGSRFTQDGSLLGTPAYMPPEQLAGATVDGRTDVYAAGVLLGELVAGRHPLADGGPPRLPTGIATIVNRCLQPDPSARYASAAALVDALRVAAGVDAASPAPPRALWWWQFHQAVTSTTYGALLVPAWFARKLLGAELGRAVLVFVLVAGVAAVTMRLHLLFVSRSGAAAVARERARLGVWFTLSDGAFAAGLVVAGLLAEPVHSVLGVVLMIGGVAAGVAAAFIEPSTTRATSLEPE